MSDLPDIVVGSGPAGVAAATALLARGRPVLMLDGGRELESEAIARRDALARTDPTEWPSDTRERWMAAQYETPSGQVRRYGSDFAMMDGRETFADLPDWLGLRASHAVGGLSNLWGSAILPYRADDIDDWPVPFDDLAPHYEAVTALLPVSGVPDDLDRLLPGMAMDGRDGIPPSVQARDLLKRLGAKRERLAARHVHFGRARQAVADGCRRCGLCLHGCPYSLIWSARQALPGLAARPGFTHRPGAPVTRFEESEGHVTLHLADGTSLDGARVFLGAGVLESARILLASSPSATELMLKDSQHAFLPMLQRWRNRERPDQGAFHTLPQIFVEIDAPEVSPRLVHAQIYTWNEHFPRDLIANYASKLPLSAPLFTALARRLIVAQIFLHSDHSHRIGLALAPDGRLKARLDRNEAMGPVLVASTQHLARAMGLAGLTALTFASRPGAPGSSFHAGGTMPMSREPGKQDSDTLGRPSGLERVHLIDASSLPTIPATTITLSVMANAHRIGSLAP